MHARISTCAVLKRSQLHRLQIYLKRDESALCLSFRCCSYLYTNMLVIPTFHSDALFLAFVIFISIPPFWLPSLHNFLLRFRTQQVQLTTKITFGLPLLDFSCPWWEENDVPINCRKWHFFDFNWTNTDTDWEAHIHKIISCEYQSAFLREKTSNQRFFNDCVISVIFPFFPKWFPLKFHVNWLIDKCNKWMMKRFVHRFPLGHLLSMVRKAKFDWILTAWKWISICFLI